MIHPSPSLRKLLQDRPDLTCADRSENTQLYEMGRQGWEMVSLSKLEETVPGGQWCRGVMVGYGFEVVWKRVR